MTESNQEITSIERWGNGDRDIYLDSINSGTEMERIGFGQNSDDGILHINTRSYYEQYIHKMEKFSNYDNNSHM